jgi:polar amino acid transport system substrate-binding protein
MSLASKRLSLLFSLLVLTSLILAACAPAAAPTAAPQPTQPPQTEPTAAPEPTMAPEATTAPEPTTAPDYLSEILKRGTLVISTDPAYPPQSELVENATHPADTKCAADQHTASELKGFDIDAAVEIAKRLGVEACFVTPDWTLITGGSWSDRWDISVGSMTITPERMQVLYFSQPYYTTPAAVFVHKDNTTYTQAADLSGKKVGACSGCTYESYLEGTLVIPGEKIDYLIKNPEFKGYDTDTSALQDLALGSPIFFEYLAAAIDKKASQDPQSFVEKVSEVIQQMHSDGTLLKLSQQYYGTDLTTAAAKFDVNALDQFAK